MFVRTLQRVLFASVILALAVVGFTGPASAAPVDADGVCTEQSCRPPETPQFKPRPEPFKPKPDPLEPEPDPFKPKPLPFGG